MGLHFYDTRKALTPQRGDRLLYDIEHSLLEYHRPLCEPILWDDGDDKTLLPRLTDTSQLVAVAEAIGAIFGLGARLDNERFAHNPNLASRFWCVKFI